ncbi:unnamed protein product [Rotaria sp. Silwood2]|nr:unnamed protein product [Rotaria sp. Silwood2]
MIYSMNQSFVLPPNCSYISSNRCSVKLLFWFERRNYVVTFPGDILNDDNIDDNRHFVMIEVAMNTFFSYDINHVCKNKDDCARNFAEKKIIAMTQRSFNISNIYTDLERILFKKESLDDDLLCFDSNEAVRQCAIAGMMGSCQIIDDLIKYNIHRRTCQRHSQESASVNIYDSNSFAIMTVKCNRMLCNGPLTIEAVKNVLNHYNITDVNGRLPGNSSRLSIKYYLFILIFFCSFFEFN